LQPTSSTEPPGSESTYDLNLYPFSVVDPSWVLSGGGGPLGEYIWAPSLVDEPAPTPTQEEEGTQPTDHRIESQDHYSFQETHENTGASGSTSLITNTGPRQYLCEDCSQSFPRQCDLNRHSKKHSLPFSCEVCHNRFRYRKDLNRHRSAKHPEAVTNFNLLYCPHPGCRFSIQQGIGTTREDNLRRHMQTQHGDCI